MKTGYVIGGILVLAIALVLVFTSGSSSSDSGSITGNVVSDSGNAVSGDSGSAGSSQPDVIFEISSSRLRFFLDGVESPELKVKQDDKVRVVFTNEEGFHDFVIDEFEGTRTQQLQAGNTETIEFVADKKGTFEYYCSVGQHRANGMYGKFIVE